LLLGLLLLLLWLLLLLLLPPRPLPRLFCCPCLMGSHLPLFSDSRAARTIFAATHQLNELDLAQILDQILRIIFRGVLLKAPQT
jgi:hypothetical protein